MRRDVGVGATTFAPEWTVRTAAMISSAGARSQGVIAPQGAAEPGVEALGAPAAGMVMGLLEA